MTSTVRHFFLAGTGEKRTQGELTSTRITCEVCLKASEARVSGVDHEVWVGRGQARRGAGRGEEI